MKFAKYVGTPFLQSTTGRLLLVIAVSIVVKGELATINYRNCKLKHICPNLSRKRKLLKGQSWWKNRFEKHSFADFKLDVLKHFVNSTRKHLCWSPFSIKFAGLKVCNSVKKRLQHRCLPGKFVNFLRTTFLHNSFSGYFWRLTLVFKNWCNCQQ